MASKTTGLKNIAFELGISVNTVSRALRDCDDISGGTKEKVRQKAFELGYLPNNISQFIRRDGKYLIAVVINSFKNLYFSIVCQKLVAIISQKNYDFTIVFSLNKKMGIEVLKQCISQRVDGIITLLEPDDEAIESARLNNIPVVLVGRDIDKEFIDQVYMNDEDGGKMVANYFINYHKLDKFVYVKMANVECSKRRLKGFEETIRETLPEGQLVVIDEKQAPGELTSLIKKGYNGIFCFNDELAYAVLKQLNLEIPNFRKVYPHMHIVGCDCLNTREDGLIDITSVDFDYDLVCQTAFDLLADRFQNAKRPRKSIELPVILHQRKYF
jgi:DNA-binding LacI/PurR family transcriptional regulator